MASQIAVCLATYREDNFSSWYSAWKGIFTKHNISLYVAWDSQQSPPFYENVAFIRQEIFPNFIPKGSSACRSVAVKAAYDGGHEYIMFLDDDVLPPKDKTDPIQAYLDGFKMNVKGTGYYDVSGGFYAKGFYSRGFPYKERQITPVVAQYGGWDHTPDFDARDSNIFKDNIGCSIADYKFKFERKVEVVPKYLGFTGCFMNCIFRRELAPCLFHLYQGVDNVAYDRFDDIWASLMLKRICDEYGWTILINGNATCQHERLSNITKSLFQEQKGHQTNEELWDKLQRAPLIPFDKRDVKTMYRALINQFPEEQIVPMNQWIESFQKQ